MKDVAAATSSRSIYINDRFKKKNKRNMTKYEAPSMDDTRYSFQAA